MDKTTMTPFVPQYVNHIGSCTHPNGTVFLLVTHKVGNGQFNAEIHRDDPPFTSPPKLVHTFVFGGPCGYGTLECLPDGSLYVGLPAGLKTSEDVTGNRMVIPGMAQPWTVNGAVQLLPLTLTSGGTDTLARQSAMTAITVATQAKIDATTAQRLSNQQKLDVEALRQSLASLHDKVPSEQDIKDIAWSYAGQRIEQDIKDEKSPLSKGIGSIAQAFLLAAIEYAKTNSTKKSQLRSLIEKIIGEKHASA